MPIKLKVKGEDTIKNTLKKIVEGYFVVKEPIEKDDTEVTSAKKSEEPVVAVQG